MASDPDPCVADHVLAEFAQGVLDQTELDRITSHLAQCDSCRRRAALAAAAASEGTSPPSLEPTLPDAQGSLQVPQRGTRLGRYVVLDTLGQGGVGLVFRAHDPELDRPVALKVLRSTANEKAVASLLGEARVAGRLVHPNVVTVHDVGVDQGRGFIAMELVEGGSLARWLGAERRSPQQVIDVFLAAGEGLAAAHRAGLVHRDFKPANVLMGTDGRPRVADFGLATATPQPLDPSDAPLTGTSAGGTPGYMAPEQYFRKADARSDEFAFCVSLWQALAGARPFATGENALETIRSGRPAGRIPRSVGRRARRALLRGMSFNPEDRFLSMEALLAELRAPRSLRRASAVILVAAVTATAAATATVVMRWRLPAPGPDQVAPAQTQPADATPKPDVAGPDASQGQGERDAAVPGEAIAAKAPSTHVKKGRLTVLVNPWAQVSVDGHKWGTTPLPPIELGDGKHSLVLVNPELGVRRTVTATMRQGRDVTLRINLLE